VRSGIKSVIDRLGEDMEVVGEAADGIELVESARKMPADVYVVDVSMPDMNGIEASAALLRMLPGSKIVILSMYSEFALVESAFQQGVHGYVLKETSPSDIVRAIRSVYNGQYYLSPELSGYIAKKMAGRDKKNFLPDKIPLSQREQEILQLLYEKQSEREIAEQLDITSLSLRELKKTIMEKLGIHDIPGLVRYAIKAGIVQF
jgi:DNA-binding NarL/FixJ family response regulator